MEVERRADRRIESATAFGRTFGSKKSTLGACPPEKHKIKTAHNLGGFNMRKVLLATCLSAVLGAVAAFTAGAANANDELIKLSANPKESVRPAGDYANQRYSKLNPITAA